MEIQFKMFEYLDYLTFGSNYNNTKIIHAMDLSTIKENVRSNAYECLEEYQVDIEWIYHNCFVYYSGKLAVKPNLYYNSFTQLFLYYTENHKFTSNAADLLRSCRNDLRFMENCENCFEYFNSNPIDWLVKACDFPHLVLWVNIRDSDFWPADKGRMN